MAQGRAAERDAKGCLTGTDVPKPPAGPNGCAAASEPSQDGPARGIQSFTSRGECCANAALPTAVSASARPSY